MLSDDFPKAMLEPSRAVMAQLWLAMLASGTTTHNHAKAEVLEAQARSEQLEAELNTFRNENQRIRKRLGEYEQAFNAEQTRHSQTKQHLVQVQSECMTQHGVGGADADHGRDDATALVDLSAGLAAAMEEKRQAVLAKERLAEEFEKFKRDTAIRIAPLEAYQVKTTGQIFEFVRAPNPRVNRLTYHGHLLCRFTRS